MGHFPTEGHLVVRQLWLGMLSLVCSYTVLPQTIREGGCLAVEKLSVIPRWKP